MAPSTKHATHRKRACKPTSPLYRKTRSQTKRAAEIAAEKPSLLNLPLELRTLILECLLRSSIAIPIGKGYPREPPISLACKRLREEALVIFYNSNLFDLHVDSYNINPLRYMNKQWVKYRTHELRTKYHLPFDVQGTLTQTGYPSWHNLRRWVRAARKDEAGVFDAPVGVSDLESHTIAALMETVGSGLGGLSKGAVREVLEGFRAILGAIDPRWKE